MKSAIYQILFDETPFSPRSLFANGENGVWFDGLNLPASNLFHNADGITQVIAVGLSDQLQICHQAVILN